MTTTEPTDKDEQPGPASVDYGALMHEAKTRVANPDYKLENVHDLDLAPIYRGPDVPRNELTATANEALQLLSEARSDDGVWDLTSCSPDQIISALDGLTANSSILLHGSRSDESYGELDPTKSRQQHSGKSAVINATSDAETAVYYATFDFQKFNRLGPGGEVHYNFGIGLTNYGYEGRPGRSFQLQADSISYPILQAHADDPTIYSDGYIYVLDRSQFQPSSITQGQQRSDHEWSAVEVVKPLAVIKVSANLGPSVITADKLVRNNH